MGFGVGIGSTRFHLGEPAARLLVLMVATIVDALLFGQLAQVFDVQAYELSPVGLIVRALVNGAVGMVVFETMDRQMRRLGATRVRIYEDLRTVQRRVGVVQFLVAPAVAGLLVYFWHLQVIRGKYFRDLAENNRIRALPIPLRADPSSTARAGSWPRTARPSTSW